MISCTNICTISVRIDVCEIGCIPSEWVSRLVRNNWALSWWVNGWHWLACPGPPCTSSSLCSSSILKSRLWADSQLMSLATWPSPDSLLLFTPYLSPMAKLKLAAFDGVSKQWVGRFTTITAGMIRCHSKFCDLLTSPLLDLFLPTTTSGCHESSKCNINIKSVYWGCRPYMWLCRVYRLLVNMKLQNLLIMHLERSGNFEPVGGLVLGFVRHWAPRSHLSESYVLKEIESVWQVEIESGGKLAPFKRLRVAGKLVVSFRFCLGVRCSGFATHQSPIVMR